MTSTVCGALSQSSDIDSWEDDTPRRKIDLLAVEEPLEIRLAGISVTVTMRTPGRDFDLAAGFLLTEAIIRGRDDIASLAYCPSAEPDATGNIVNVNPTRPEIVDPARWERNFVAHSGCGVCGKASIAGVRHSVPTLRDTARIEPSVLYRMANELRDAQTLFQQTGGLHGAALFDGQGQLLVAREDVGRHNAVDKVIGAMVRRGETPLSGYVLLVSSRASFEIVQKALMAGISVVAAVSAASTLAVELARETNLTLVGFLRADSEAGGRFNVYSGRERIGLSCTPVARATSWHDRHSA